MNNKSINSELPLADLSEDWDVDPAMNDGLQLSVDVDGFEGPLDLLLELSRRQKVDLSKISILALAEQYLAYVENVRKMRIELAADYLVMAAWLAFLKSKLLLPVEDEHEELTGEEMAAALAFRLQRLAAMREAGKTLVNRNRLGRDFFQRGDPEPVLLNSKKKYSNNLYDLLSAYANQRQRQNISSVTIEKREVWSLSEAKEILTRMIGSVGDWTSLTDFLLPYIPEPKMRATIVASSFAATLELVREGKLTMRQDGAFEPIYLKTAVGLQQANPQTTGG